MAVGLLAMMLPEMVWFQGPRCSMMPPMEFPALEPDFVTPIQLPVIDTRLWPLSIMMPPKRLETMTLARATLLCGTPSTTCASVHPPGLGLPGLPQK